MAQFALHGPILELGVLVGLGSIWKLSPANRPPPPHPFPFQSRIRPLEILHTNKIVTNLHPRWGVSGSRCHGDHLQGPGCLRLLVQRRDQEIQASALQLGPVLLPPGHPALLPPHRAGPEGVRWGRAARGLRVGPAGFSHFSWRPPEGQEALSRRAVNNGIPSGDSF